MVGADQQVARVVSVEEVEAGDRRQRAQHRWRLLAGGHGFNSCWGHRLPTAAGPPARPSVGGPRASPVSRAARSRRPGWLPRCYPAFPRSATVVEQVDRGVRRAVGLGELGVHRDQPADRHAQASLLQHLAGQRLLGGLARVDPAARQRPTPAVGAADQQHGRVTVHMAEDRGVDADLGGRVAELTGEPLADLSRRKAGQPRVGAAHKLRQPLVALLVVGAARVAEALLGDAADLVQQHQVNDVLVHAPTHLRSPVAPGACHESPR